MTKVIHFTRQVTQRWAATPDVLHALPPIVNPLWQPLPNSKCFRRLILDTTGQRYGKLAICVFSGAAPMNEVTRILSAIKEGDPHVAEQLLPLVYDELRRLAAEKLAQERPGQTLQATALVHEAYLRLVTPPKSPSSKRGVQYWNSRGHFFAAAAEAMRRILVEQARRKRRLKRGGGRQGLDFDEMEITVEGPSDDLLALDEALTKLADKHPEKVELVQLRYFAGLTVREAAKVLGISTSTADRYWTFARAWLYRELAPETEG
jgi:RNA polymerase sigma factor (TIGR02999 family)